MERQSAVTATDIGDNPDKMALDEKHLLLLLTLSDAPLTIYSHILKQNLLKRSDSQDMLIFILLGKASNLRQFWA